MAAQPLQRLDGATLEIEIEISGSLRRIVGTGRYDKGDPDVGPSLKILVSDPWGDFEILLPESNWKGIVEPSTRQGCDYLISLANFIPQ